MRLQSEDMTALLLQVNTCLAEAGFGEGVTLMERLGALVQAYQQAQGRCDMQHERIVEAHRAVTRHLPGGRQSGDEGLTLMERIDGLALALRRAGYEAGGAEALGRVQEAQGLGGEALDELREAYTAVAMAFPGRKEIDPEVPLAEHIQALADACYQQGYEAGKAWERGGSDDVAAAGRRGQATAPVVPPCEEEGASPCAYAQRVGADLQATAERARRLTIEVADLRGTVRALQAELRGALAALTCRDRR